MGGTSGLNSPLQITLGRTSDDPKLQGLYEAIFQLQQALVTYCGIAPQDHNFWAQYTPVNTVFPQNLNRYYAQASEVIPAGGIVSPIISGSVCKVRNANATNNTKFAIGYATGAMAIDDFGEIILGHGLCNLIGGLTPGARYYLSTVNGLVTAVAPVAAGNIEQFVGVALSATELFFNCGYFIQH